MKERINEIFNNLELYYRYEKKTFVIICLYAVMFINTFRIALESVFVIYNFNYFRLHITSAVGIIFNFLFVLAPFALWIAATSEEFFYFYKRKLNLFYFGFVNLVIVVIRYAVCITTSIVAPRILSVEPNEAWTAGMLVWSVRLIVILVAVIVGAILTVNLKRILSSRELKNNLMDFSYSRVIDARENKNYLYDQEICRDLKTGKVISFQYNDRFMHQFFQESSGTGKTTAALLKIIWYDLKQKKINQYKRYEEYVKMLEADEAFLLRENGKIRPDNIRAYSGYGEKLKKIKETYPDLGYTIIAPDTDLQEKVIPFLKIFDFDYILCDPETNNGKFKKNYKGINLLHITKGLSFNDMVESINQKANLAADVLHAVFEESGSTDVYFSGVNSSCTLNIGTVLIAAMPLIEKREATFEDLRYALNDFKLEKYVNALEAKYGKGRNINPFDVNIQWIRTNIMGDTKLREKWVQESNGLRNIMDRLLGMPSIKQTLCAEDPIDFKKVLDNGEIVFLNYSLKNGKTIAKGFGLSYVMSFNDEIKKRNFNDFLIPHFVVVDEFSKLMHSCWKEVIAWHRKYRIAYTFSFPSNAQFMKNDFTRYMAEIIQCVGQMTVFGRTDANAGKIFGAISGKKAVDVIQDTVTQASLLSDNPAYSESQRITESREGYVDAAELRNRNFLEVTVYPIKNGNVFPPVLGKLNFLTEKEKNDIPEEYFNFEQYVMEEGAVLLNEPVDITTINGEYEFGFEETNPNESYQKKDDEGKDKKVTTVPTAKKGSMDMKDYM